MERCSNCVWSIRTDSGYSNWTVEGVDINCALKLHPDAPFDRWYGSDKRDLFAENCEKFKSGDTVHIDVDKDDIVVSKDPEIRWSKYLNGYVTGQMIEENR